MPVQPNPPGTGRLDPSYSGVSTPPVDTFIQPKITGYRQLNADEATMMNEAKALGAAAEELVARLRRYHHVQRDEATSVAESQRLDNAEPGRWLAMGRTSIQVGIMQIVRSIAQPAS